LAKIMTALPRKIAAILALLALATVGFFYGRSLRPGAAPSSSATVSARGGALVATLRGEPTSFNRYTTRGFPTQLVSLLTQARLIRINRVTDVVEPWLASEWTTSADGRSVALTLRPDVTWSDGAPFDADDVAFSFRAAYDEANGSVMAATLTIGGGAIVTTVIDPHHVKLTFPAPFAPGVRVLDALPIYPRHALEASLADGTFSKTWGLTTAPASMPGLGPFVFESYTPGQRIVFARNPKYFRKDSHGTPLPYLDRLTLEIVPDQNAEILRLTSGQADVLQSDLRPQDYRVVKDAADQKRVTLIDVGPGLERYLLWFNIGPHAPPDHAFLQADAFREAISLAVDRKALADAVYLGAADPSALPVPPSNREWLPDGVTPPAHDPARAAALLDGLGLVDRNHDGIREDASGHPVRFSVLVQSGVTAGEKGVQFVRDELAKVGVGLDVVGLDVGSVIDRWQKGDYEAIYHHLLPSDTDPAVNLDWWLSGGDMHVWNPGQHAPATPWEAEIDAAMQKQAATPDLAERKRLFTDVQRVFLAHNPAIYFAASHVYVATSRRVGGAAPALNSPQVLWAADELSVAQPAP
jgi:peptide/nickel transport system substrate-binding protein